MDINSNSEHDLYYFCIIQVMYIWFTWGDLRINELIAVILLLNIADWGEDSFVQTKQHCSWWTGEGIANSD